MKLCDCVGGINENISLATRTSATSLIIFKATMIEIQIKPSNISIDLGKIEKK